MRWMTIVAVVTAGCSGNDDLRQRVEELEKRLERVESVTPGTAGRLKGTAFILVDKNGAERAELSFGDPNGGPGIHVRDSDGRTRARLFVDAMDRGRFELVSTSGDSLGVQALADQFDGRLIVDSLRVTGDLLRDRPTVGTFEVEELRAKFVVVKGDADQPTVFLQPGHIWIHKPGEEGKPTVALSVEPEHAGLSVEGKGGTVRAWVTETGDQPILRAYDRNGRPVADGR